MVVLQGKWGSSKMVTFQVLSESPGGVPNEGPWLCTGKISKAKVKCKQIYLELYTLHGFPGGKESASQYRRSERRRFDPWVGEIPWSRK